jgi:hypothetical protein
VSRFRFDQYAPNESPGQSTIGTTPLTGQTAIGGNNDDEIAIAGNRHSMRAIAAMDSPGTHSASQ